MCAYGLAPLFFPEKTSVCKDEENGAKAHENSQFFVFLHTPFCTMACPKGIQRNANQLFNIEFPEKLLIFFVRSFFISYETLKSLKKRCSLHFLLVNCYSENNTV